MKNNPNSKRTNGKLTVNSTKLMGIVKILDQENISQTIRKSNRGSSFSKDMLDMSVR